MPSRVRRHLRRHVKVPIPGAVPLYGDNEILRSGVNKHGVEFETMSLRGLMARYGKGPARRRLLNNLVEHLAQYRDDGVRVKEFAVYGSFVSDKPDPGDIDVAIWREPMTEVSDRIWSHEVGKREHGVDSFSVVSRRHYANWLAHPRERGHKRVVRLKG